VVVDLRGLVEQVELTSCEPCFTSIDGNGFHAEKKLIWLGDFGYGLLYDRVLCWETLLWCHKSSSGGW